MAVLRFAHLDLFELVKDYLVWKKTDLLLVSQCSDGQIEVFLPEEEQLTRLKLWADSQCIHLRNLPGPKDRTILKLVLYLQRIFREATPRKGGEEEGKGRGRETEDLL